MASELSRRLRKVADEYLTHVNRDRPEHLEADHGAEHRAGGVKLASRASRNSPERR